MRFMQYILAGLVTLLFVPVAGADWSDDFDSYALGSGLHGQGGWTGWDNDPAFDAYTTDIHSYSTPHSAAILPTSDIVHQYTETAGQWTMTGWSYIPSGSTGSQYFILLNTYNHGGPYEWSLQLHFDSTAGTLIVVEGSGTTAIINNQWIEVKVNINLDTNNQQIYYNGILLDTIPWMTSGVVEIAALDLFSNGGSTIYWDDLSLVETTALQRTTWGEIKATDW
jgi:hypothetical protein